MSRRNPMNERELVDGNKPGKTRKSAASAKPKSHAAESGTGRDPRAKKEVKKEQKEKKPTRAERKAQDEAYFNSLGPRAREKRLHEQYVKWETWRRRMVILAFITLFIALIYQYSVMRPDPTITVVLWILPFACIGVGVWISYAKQRPLGRVLGIRYGKEDKDTRKAKAQEIKAREDRERAERNAKEDAVKERVQQKQEKVNEREARRLRNRAAEVQREEERKAAAGKTASKKTKNS